MRHVNLRKFQATVAIGLACSHLAILLLIYVLFMAGGYTFAEMTTSIALLTPMLGIYVTSGVKHVIRMASVPDDGKVVNFTYAFFTTFFPGLFSVALCLLAISW